MRKKDLSPAALEAVEKQALSGAFDLRSLLGLLDELDRWDQSAEQRKSSAQGIRTAGVMATVTSSVLLVLVMFIAPGPLPLLFLLLALAASIALLKWGQKQVKAAIAMDVPDEVRLGIQPVLRQLSHDLDPKGKIKVDLDLHAYNPDRCATTSEIQLRKGGPFTKVSVYEEPLGSLRLPLADGSTAVLKIANSFHKLVKKSSSRSGRIKTKEKWKKVCTVTGMLIPAAPVTWQEARMRPFIDTKQEVMSFVQKDGVTVARIDRFFKFKAPTVRPTNLAPVADIMSIFVRLAAMRPPTKGAPAK